MLSNPWATGSSAVTLASILGAVVAVLRASGKTKAGELWRGEAEAWAAKAERLERAVQELTERVERLEQENKVLRSLLIEKGGAPDVAAP